MFIAVASTCASRKVARTIRVVIESSSGTLSRKPFKSPSVFNGESARTRKLARY